MRPAPDSHGPRALAIGQAAADRRAFVKPGQRRVAASSRPKRSAAFGERVLEAGGDEPSIHTLTDRRSPNRTSIHDPGHPRPATAALALPVAAWGPGFAT